MRLPNGYGSVYKLSGKRRNPWVARVTVGWRDDDVKMRSYPIYKFIGYYPNRREALAALAVYNADPDAPIVRNITLDDIHSRWLEEKEPKMSQSTYKGYRAAWAVLKPIAKMPIANIKLDVLQNTIDTSGKYTPTLRNVKFLLNQIYDYAVSHEYVTPFKREMINSLDISKAGNPNQIKRTIFTADEIASLWSFHEDPRVQPVLMMIYTGVRIGELLAIHKNDVHLSEQYFHIPKSKTKTGIRDVPIADKVLPFFASRMAGDSDYLFPGKSSHMSDGSFRQYIWRPAMNAIGSDHKPHDTRHTCVTLLTERGVDDRIIKSIVGHSGQSITALYTHIEIQPMLDAVNLL